MKPPEQRGQARPYHAAVTYAMRWVRTGVALAILSVLGWLGGCSDNPSGPTCCDPPPQGLIASDPVAVASTALAAGAESPPGLSASAGDAVVYVSLLPGTAPAGSRAIVRRVGHVPTLITSVLDGGFDPVPIGAQAADSIEVLVRDAAGGIILQARFAVAAARPPIVVRTNPPRKKTDVPLNSAIVVVFSEPVADGSLTPASVRLLRGTTPVAGAVSLLQGSAAAIVFTPSAPLDANTDYQLVVTQAVRDLEGDPVPADVSVEFTTGTATVSPAWSVSVVPDTTTVLIGSQVQLIAAARDTIGTPLTDRPVSWSSDNSAIATVSASGLVTALGQGEAHIRAQVDFGEGVGVVLAAATLAPLDSVEVTPQSATVPVTGPVQFTAVLRDAAGNVLPFRAVTWAGSDSNVARVAAGSGGSVWVTGVSPGTVTITASSEGKSGRAAMTVVSYGSYAEIDAGDGHTCAVTSDSWALCWGSNGGGELGIGYAGGTVSVPVGVADGRRFIRVSAYMGRTCALTPPGAAYCWGQNGDSVLGAGGYYISTPAPVPGGLAFTAIGVGQHHMCALTPAGAVYCWGWSGGGELGTGTTSGPEVCGGVPCSTAPLRVAGGRTFSSLTIGDSHTCALAAGGQAYCWGANFTGALGDGSTASRASPVPVFGGFTFAALSAGYYSTCGSTSDSAAYCWGLNADGQLGTGTNAGPESCIWGSCSTAPLLVAGGIHWSAISAGGQAGHTCALDANGNAYCWGANGRGQLGNGSTTESAIPVAVLGSLVFASVSAGANYSCGLAAGNVAYCWGGNYVGQLGNGTTIDSSVPVKVAGQP